MLPTAVMERAQSEFSDWHGTGMSIMEMSHRGAHYMEVAQKSEANLRELMTIPDNYKVLFLQGGATLQFSAIPLNLLGDKISADYILTGDWGLKAIDEAKRFCQVNIAGDTTDADYTTVPRQDELKLDPNAAYVHYTPNETIRGTEFDYIPETGDVPLVADFSSSILSREIDVTKFGVIYAGAQKNIGPAGLTIVIVRDDLLDLVSDDCPRVMRWGMQAENDSMLNTPSTYSWYMAGLVFEWLKEMGGLSVIEKKNRHKAEKLYAAIDSMPFYNNPVNPINRSWMNVPFTLANSELDKTFLEESHAAGLTTLKGHKIVGGMRASIYNSMPEEGVDALIEFMREFERTYG